MKRSWHKCSSNPCYRPKNKNYSFLMYVRLFAFSDIYATKKGSKTNETYFLAIKRNSKRFGWLLKGFIFVRPLGKWNQIEKQVNPIVIKRA